MLDFFKYQSLGNDFMLFDWLDKPADEINNTLNDVGWPKFVRSICKREDVNVGADGVLIVKHDKSNNTEVLIFNSDGSDGEKCLNGARCVAHYLFAQKKFPKNFNLSMCGDRIKCQIKDSGGSVAIIMNVGKANCIEQHELSIEDVLLRGQVVDIGNPHFVIEKEVTSKWLSENGKSIECHKYFPRKTNVEFIWKNQKESKQKRVLIYNMLVYERGCGLTKACGTGAAAVIQVLYDTKKIKKNEIVWIKMPGGVLKSFVNDEGDIVQEAEDVCTFAGFQVDKFSG
jgi:diaminopimelate epimerase